MRKAFLVSVVLAAFLTTLNASSAAPQQSSKTKIIEAPGEKIPKDNRPVPKEYGTQFMDERMLYDSTKEERMESAFKPGIDKTDDDEDSKRMREAQEEAYKKRIQEYDKDNPPPKAHEDGFNVDKSKMFGDDRATTTDRIDTGMSIKVRVGENAGELKVDDSGNSNIVKDPSKEVNKENSAMWRNEAEEKSFEEKRAKLNEEINKTRGMQEGSDELKASERKAKRQRDELMQEGKTTIKAIGDFTLKGQDVFSQGQGTTTNFKTQNQKFVDDEYNGRLSFNAMEHDKNASKLYNELFGYKPWLADQGQIVKNNNYGVLTEAYKNLPGLQKLLTEKMREPIIKCQISRSLIPSFYCPIPGKSGARFPGKLPASIKKAAEETITYTDQEGKSMTAPANPGIASLIDVAAIAKKTNIKRAQAACDSFCFTDPNAHDCVGEKKLTTKEIPINADSQITVFPQYNISETSFFIDVKDVIPVKEISFKIKYERAGGDETKAQWTQFLNDAFVKMRYSVLEVPQDDSSVTGKLSPITIVDRAVAYLQHDEVIVTVPVNRAITKLQIKMWKPYISTNALHKENYDHYLKELEEDWKAKIIVSDLKAEYLSNSWFYCSSRQLVGQPNDCAGGNYKKVKFGSAGLNTLYICLAARYRIGPEPTTGAFYTEDSCTRACVKHEKCVPTYDHYNGDYGNEAEIYKVEIDCVDDPANTKCTKKKCEELFKDYEKMPINEIIVHNDNTMEYTVKMKQVTNKPPRPKIDVEAELSGAVNSKESREAMLNREQKDAAYQYMLDKLTLNRITYPIGTPAPTKLASKYEETPGDNPARTVEAELKPNSFDYASGTWNLYMVARMDQKYTPRYGSYYYRNQKSNNISVHTKQGGNTMYVDSTYLIRKPGTQPSWQVFRKDEFAQVLTFFEGPAVQEDGSVQHVTRLEWTAIHQSNDERNFFGEFRPMISNNGKKFGDFVKMSPSTLAIPFAKQDFNPQEHYFSYIATQNEYQDMFGTPGAGIWGQSPLDNESKLEKVYIKGAVPENYMDKGIVSGIWMFLIYTKQQLTYDDIMKMIEGPGYANPGLKKDPVVDNQYVFYSNLRDVRPKHVDHDGELLNGKNPYIMGKPGHTYVNAEWEPSISEQGKKAFRFLFIYDDEFSDLGRLGITPKETSGEVIYDSKKAK